MQVGHDKAPRFGLAEPGPHDWQALAPLDAWNVPAPQLAHELWPPDAWKVPGLQLAHAV